MVLTGCTQSTLEAWRKRGTGPAYALLGNAYIYPIEGVKSWLADNLRERAPRAKDGL